MIALNRTHNRVLALLEAAIPSSKKPQAESANYLKSDDQGRLLKICRKCGRSNALQDMKCMNCGESLQV